MCSDIYRFAGEAEPPVMFVNTLTDRSIGTLRGKFADDKFLPNALMTVLDPELTDSDPLSFDDVEDRRTPDLDTLIDRFEDATGGVHPGHPTVKLRDIEPDANAAAVLGVAEDATTAALQRFYELTGLRPRVVEKEPYALEEPSWGGDSSKLYARVRLPRSNPEMTSLLHELGHCSMSLVGFGRNRETVLDGLQHRMNTNWPLITEGLTYRVEGGDRKGSALEEAVADGLGTLVNRRLGLVRTRFDDEAQRLPKMVAPYLVGDNHSMAAPAAVALELIAKEIGLASDRYLRMLVGYADAGVRDADARQEIAQTVYRGTRGRLTLGQVEELPYPINTEASLALLWAVEDAQDVPDHERYSDLFFN